MGKRTVTIDVDGVQYTALVLDSSDGCENANVYLAEIQEWSVWLRRVYDRFLPMPEGRRYRMEAAGTMCATILARYGLDEAMAAAASGEIVRKVIDRMVPGTAADEPEQPGATTMERIARAKEFRRAAFGKLLREQLVDCEAEARDGLLDRCRNEELMWQVLDAVMSGGAAAEDGEADEAG